MHGPTLTNPNRRCHTFSMQKWKATGLTFLVLSAFGAVGTGCVSAQKFNDLEAEHTKTQEELAAAVARVNELEAKLGIAREERTKLEGSVAEMHTALAELRERKAEAEKRLKEFRELTAKFRKLVDAGKLTVKIINGKMVLGLSSDILFPSGSAKLSPQGLSAIKEVAGLLKSLEGRHFQVEGHTDNVPIKSSAFPSNWELASARATSVLSTMLEAGFPPARISAASYADTQPVADNGSTEGKTANRRIAIVVVPDLSGLPGFDELTKIAEDPAKPETP